MVYLSKINKLKFIKIFILLFLLAFIVVLLQYQEVPKQFEIAENYTDSEINLQLSLETLREDVTDCFINFKIKDEDTYPFNTEHTENTYENVSTGRLSDKHAIFTVLTSFSNILSLLHIKAAVIEPSMLYCMLLPEYQELLSKRHFNVSDFSGSNRVVTFGIMEEDADILQQDKHAIFTVLTSFSNILSLLHIKAAVIEPSMLYCMLLPEYQELLSKRHFNVSDFSGSDRVVTFGIMEEDVAVLQKERNKDTFSILDFKVHVVEAPLTDWMRSKVPTSEFRIFYSHIFFMHKLCTIHLVVFQRRSQYFWHAALDVGDGEEKLSKEKLLFTDHDGAYEKFLFVSLENNMPPVADFYVPSNTHYFLFEMLSSRFLECNFSRAASVVSTSQTESHPDMSVEQFNIRTRFGLRELKKVFHPLLMHLWIWSGTMLGWYRQCDIIPYTTDVDFASWASDVDDLDSIINPLLSSKYITIKGRMGFIEEALELHTDCYGLRTDVFFLYRIKNGTWCSGHSPNLGYYFRYFYPPFTLCSSELLGEKVQVPCETESVIISEYGKDWNKPISSWHYENSPKTRGPKIYWEKQKLKQAYQIY